VFVLPPPHLHAFEAIVKEKKLYEAPKERATPFWIRGLLILTCTGVSFFHGSNTAKRAWA